jgi:transcription antitermination factor NusA-like protein
MTFRTTTTMPRSQRRKPDVELVRDFTQPLPQVADRSVRAMHIVLSRGKFARAISTQGRNVRLAIWLPGWHIEIYDEFGEQSYLFGAR